MTSKDKLYVKAVLASQVYRVVKEATVSFDVEYVGSDLAYLLGAILTGGFCEWSADRPLVVLLRQHFPAGHSLWNHIVLEEQ